MVYVRGLQTEVLQAAALPPCALLPSNPVSCSPTTLCDARPCMLHAAAQPPCVLQALPELLLLRSGGGEIRAGRGEIVREAGFVTSNLLAGTPQQARLCHHCSATTAAALLCYHSRSSGGT